MTRKVGKTVIIEPSAPEPCSRCKKNLECRDLLGDGKPICFGCSTPREREAYIRRLFGR